MSMGILAAPPCRAPPRTKDGTDEDGQTTAEEISHPHDGNAANDGTALEGRDDAAGLFIGDVAAKVLDEVFLDDRGRDDAAVIAEEET